MTTYNRGDTALVNFVFSDESGVKRRPAVIVSSDAYNRGRDEVVISAITSKTDRILAGDHLLADWQNAGLLFPSVATGIIRTIKQSVIDRKLGSIARADIQAIESKLKQILGVS